MDIADKNTLRDVLRWLRYVMLTIFITNYFDIFYGGYLWLLFVSLAGMFMAMASIVDNEAHFRKSVFKNLNPKFFCKELSWENKNKMPWYIPDGLTDFWHICVGASVFFSIVAVSLNSFNYWYETLCIGLYFFWSTFSAFYDIILKRK